MSNYVKFNWSVRICNQSIRGLRHDRFLSFIKTK